jgi:hypothetical protein
VKGARYLGNWGTLGAISKIEKPQVRVIDSMEGLRSLWKEMGANPSCEPDLDLSQEIVIAFFDHKQPRGISSFEYVNHHVELKYQCPPWSHTLSYDAARPGTAYRLVMIDKPSVKLQIFPESYDKMPSSPPTGDCLVIEYVPAVTHH